MGDHDLGQVLSQGAIPVSEVRLSKGLIGVLVTIEDGQLLQLVGGQGVEAVLQLQAAPVLVVAPKQLHRSQSQPFFRRTKE